MQNHEVKVLPFYVKKNFICKSNCKSFSNEQKFCLTLIGLRNSVEDFIESLLKNQGVFVRELDSNSVPYHSSYMSSSAVTMTETLKQILPNPKLRPRHWVSTAIKDTDRVETEGRVEICFGRIFFPQFSQPSLFL